MSQDSSTLIMDRLRSETRTVHDQVEQLPYFMALANAALPRDSYRGYLGALKIIYEDLEAALNANEDPVVMSVWHSGLGKRSLIAEDMAWFEMSEEQMLPDSRLAALIIAEDIRYRSIHDPISLLGYLYVFQGSDLGGMVLRGQVEKNFHPEKVSLAFLSDKNKTIKQRWDEFSQKMNAAVSGPEDGSRIIAAAAETFAALSGLFKTLYPIQTDILSYPVNALNFEAGGHGVTVDSLEIRAALRAGRITWDYYPYLEQRYGERGKRFTRSDSAWIVNLVQTDAEEVQRQLRWLGRVLSNRGMPQIILENHLRQLLEELLKLAPENQENYQKLSMAADDLAAMRSKILSKKKFEKLAADFEAVLASVPAVDLPGCGELLLGAIIDEQLGIPNALNSLSEWLLDADRFSSQWQQLLRQQIEIGQAALK